jgi:crotonobetainyl-CoA:carnitine CoA-transferase CaiB-like acyl-CoA transferase
LPLEGILVVAVEQAVAAPFASRQLADLGARVIKIERPGVGDFARSYDTTVKGMASHFVWTNRSKESLARRRCASWLRLDEAAHQHPRLVTCEISGYGSPGPYRDKKAYDLLVQSEAGLLSITGTEEIPSKVGISIADIAAGMYARSPSGWGFPPT